MFDEDFMKIYKVEFIQYTNVLKNTVGNGKEGTDRAYHSFVNGEPLLAKESDLEYLSQYGEGFRNVEFVGYLFNSQRKHEKLKL